jgi:hypothetical protein
MVCYLCYNGFRICGYVHNRNAIISRNQRGVIVNIANTSYYPIHLFRMHQLQKNLNNGFISFV